MDVKPKARIAYLSYDGMTDPLGQSQVLPYLIGLSKEGYSITLISFEKPDRFEAFKNHIQEICQQANIQWIPHQYTKRPPVISTLIDVFKMNRSVKTLHADCPIDLIHCRSYIAALVGQGFKKKLGIPFVFDMRGFWADERLEGNIWPKHSIIFTRIYRFFKKKEKAFFQQADHVISLTEAGKAEILSWRLPHQSEITVNPCCVDLEKFDPQRIDVKHLESLRKSLDLSESDYILGYVGSIGTWYMLPEMLLYFKGLMHVQPSTRFLFISSENTDVIHHAAMELDIPLDRIRIQRAKHDEVPAYIALFNESVFFIRPTFSKKASSPTKQGEIMAMGIPLTCNSGIGDTDRIVNNYHSGRVLEKLDRQTLLEAAQLPLNFSKVNTQTGALEVYGLNAGINRLVTVYQKILKQ